MRSKNTFCLFFVVMILLLFSCVSAKAEVVSLSEKKNNEGWKLTGQVRSRYEWWDWFSPKIKGIDNNYPYWGNLARIKATNEKKFADTTIELAIPFLFFLPEDSAAPPPFGLLGIGANYRAANSGNFASIFLKQANLNLKGILSENNSIRLGRFEFADGTEYFTGDPTLDWLKKNRIAHRLIGNFGFTHIQRSFDGFQIVQNNPLFNTTIVGARPTQGVFDLQGHGNLRDVNFLYSAITPKFSSKNVDARIFYLLYDDDRILLKSDNRPLASLRRDIRDIFLNTFGGHYIQKIGPVDLLAWGTFQFGDWGILRQRAFAYDVEAGYKLENVPMKPHLRIGRTRSSGDSNPNDGKHETFFQMLPTPRFYARFPFFNMMNIKDNFVQLLFSPRKKITLGLEFHNLRLAEPNDLWYLGGGAFNNSSFGYVGRPASDKRTLANLIDIQLDYKISKNLDFVFYFGHAIGESVIHSIYPGRRGNFTYWELTRYF